MVSLKPAVTFLISSFFFKAERGKGQTQEVTEAEVLETYHLPDGWKMCVIRQGQMKFKRQIFSHFFTPWWDLYPLEGTNLNL